MAINSTTAIAGKAGFTLASAATTVVEFMVKWSNLCLPKVHVKIIIFIQDVGYFFAENLMLVVTYRFQFFRVFFIF